jgi:hypothetical protein
MNLHCQDLIQGGGTAINLHTSPYYSCFLGLLLHHFLFAQLLLLSACLAYYSTLKTDAAHSSKTSINFYKTAGHNFPQDGYIH